MVSPKGERRKHKRAPNEILIQFNNSCKGNGDILATLEPQPRRKIKNETDHREMFASLIFHLCTNV